MERLIEIQKRLDGTKPKLSKFEVEKLRMNGFLNSELFPENITDIDNMSLTAKGNRKPVCSVNRHGEVINTYDSVSIAAIKTGIPQSSISFVCNNKRKLAGGLKWRFV